MLDDLVAFEAPDVDDGVAARIVGGRHQVVHDDVGVVGDDAVEVEVGLCDRCLRDELDESIAAGRIAWTVFDEVLVVISSSDSRLRCSRASASYACALARASRVPLK